MSKALKKKICIFSQFLQKNKGDEDFLAVDKHNSFLQVDIITLGVHN